MAAVDEVLNAANMCDNERRIRNEAADLLITWLNGKIDHDEYMDALQDIDVTPVQAQISLALRAEGLL